MNVAVTSLEADMCSGVDRRFARARYFIVVDSDTGRFTAHPNPHSLNEGQDPRLHVAQDVVGMGVDAVITGNIGHKAFSTLQEEDVDVYVGAEGSVNDAVEQWCTGRLGRSAGLRFERHRVGLRYENVY